jgi:hypothetical protein
MRSSHELRTFDRTEYLNSLDVVIYIENYYKIRT